MIGNRKTVVSVPGFYVKKKATVPEQRKTGETSTATAREPPNTVKPNMVSDNHGNPPPVTNIDDTFLPNKLNIDHLHLNPCLVPPLIPEDSFEKNIEEIDRELRKFDLPSSNTDTKTDTDNPKTPLTATRTTNMSTPHNLLHTSIQTKPKTSTTTNIPNPTPPSPDIPKPHIPHHTFIPSTPITLTTPVVSNPTPPSAAIPNLTPPSSNALSRPTWKRILRTEEK
nr:hypothetical protein CFP56_40783 [Quercus suber]